MLPASRITTAAVALLGVTLAACSPGAKADADSTAAASVAAAPASGDPAVSSTAAWTPLIDSSMTAWREWKRQAMPAGWRVLDGVLMKDGAVGDLQSRAQFANFELEFDWMVGEAGNAGVFYRVTEEYDKPYWTGPEYQLLDDERHPDGKDRLRSAASAYGLYDAPKDVVKPAGQWNTARIIVNRNNVQHWLNGQKVVQYELTGIEWTAKVKASKFTEFPKYGLAPRGYLAIQGDHTGSLGIRNLRIREL